MPALPAGVGATSGSSTVTLSAPRERPRTSEPVKFAVLVRVQQHRRIEALEAGQHAPIGIVHDALRVFVDARTEQHADHHVILRPSQVFANSW